MMAGVVLSKGSFEGADFWRADLSEAQLESTTCSRCEFEWAILVRARMAGAVLQDAVRKNSPVRAAGEDGLYVDTLQALSRCR